MGMAQYLDDHSGIFLRRILTLYDRGKQTEENNDYARSSHNFEFYSILIYSSKISIPGLGKWQAVWQNLPIFLEKLS
jgi:hypothetical protein